MAKEDTQFQSYDQVKEIVKKQKKSPKTMEIILTADNKVKIKRGKPS